MNAQLLRSRVLLAAFAIAIGPVSTNAEEPSLQEVIVLGSWLDDDKRGRVTNEAAGLPSGLAVISREELTTINVGNDISNVFRRVPGVMSNSLGQGDTGNGFRMRGFATQGTHGADTAVYVDHVPQNMPSSEAGAGHGPAFLEWLTPTIFERIEVIKGPVSALHGDQNRSGAVNIETIARAPSSQVALALESFDGQRASMLLSHDFGRVSSTLAADVYRTDSHRKGAWTDRDNFFWKTSVETDASRYSVRLNHYRSEFEAGGYLRYDRLSSGAVGRNDPEENALLAFGDGKRTALVINRTPIDDANGVVATLYLEDFERLRGASAGGLAHNAGSDDRRIMGGRVAYRGTFGETASLETGLEARRDDGTGIRQRLENRGPTSTYLTYLDMDLLTYGAFAQAQYKPWDSFKLHAGLRADWFDYDIDNLKLPAASTTYRDSVVTPKVGVVWSALPALDVFANVAQGFRSPASQQISPSGAAGSLQSPGGVINDAISPSKVESYDIGVNAALLARWTATATYFYTLNDDEIVQAGPNIFASVGDTTREGFEIETRARIFDWFAAYASYTRLFRAQINDAPLGAADKVSVPKHQAKIGAEVVHKLTRGSLRYNLDAYTTRDTPYFSGSPLVERDVPTYVRYDVRAAYDIGAFQLAAFAIIQPHLISEAYFANASGLWVSTQPREHYGLSLRYSF